MLTENLPHSRGRCSGAHPVAYTLSVLLLMLLGTASGHGDPWDLTSTGVVMFLAPLLQTLKPNPVRSQAFVYGLVLQMLDLS